MLSNEGLPNTAAMNAMTMPLLNARVTAANAVPTTKATAISTRLPLVMNSLNSSKSCFTGSSVSPHGRDR